MSRDDTAQTVARALLDSDAFLLRPARPFRLTSGLLAPFYINCRRLLSHAEARSRVAEAQAAAIRSGFDLGEIDMVAGGVTAGVPFATLVADRLALPLVYVRSEPKGHGTGSQIEGGDVAGKRVLLVEDLITTATSILKFANALRGAGATVRDVSVIFSRITEAALPALAEAGLSLAVLCDLETLLALAQADGLADDRALADVRGFLADPKAWSEAHERAA